MKTILPCLAVLLLALPATAAEEADLLATARADGRFTTLAAALERADLADALRADGPLTVFAPTDEAFAALPDGVLARLLTPAGQADLRALLLRHVVAGRVTAGDLLPVARARTLGGDALPLGLRVDGANVIQADVPARNGVLHVIDRVLVPARAPARTAAAPARRMDAVQTIEDAIARGVPLYNAGHEAACAEVYAAAAAALLADEHALGAWDRTDLRSAHTAAGTQAPAEQAWTLRHAFDRILANASFEPRMEAPLPEGFPQPGPVGRIVTKSYPRYRAARTGGGSAFWALFNHIKKNDVQMTAPVEMTLDGQGRMEAMAFLYEEPEQGTAGTQGSVSVLDLEATRVLSIGLRGRRDAGTVAKAKALVVEHMKKHGLRSAGAWRVLGYNSPMVPADRQFWELQVPIRP